MGKSQRIGERPSSSARGVVVCRRVGVLALMIGVIAAVVGCQPSGKAVADAANRSDAPSSGSSPGAGSVQVREIVASGRLADEDRTWTVQRLRERLRRLLEQDRRTSAALLVQSLPDVASSLLLETVPPTLDDVGPPGAATGAAEQATQLERFVASVLDHGTSPPAGYRRLADLRQQRLPACMSYLQKRQAWAAAIAVGDSATAGAIPLVALARVSGSRLLLAEAGLSQATAWVLLERPDAAAAALAEALNAAPSSDAHLQVRLLLALDDATRRMASASSKDIAGQPTSAITQPIWSRAASLAASARVHEPWLWRRLAYQRLTTTAWPPESPMVWRAMLGGWANTGRHADLGMSLPAAASGETTTQTAPSADGESLLWAVIASQHLTRGEHAAALSAFKQAQAVMALSASGTGQHVWSDRLMVMQARCLLAMGQSGSAVALLTQVASATEDPLASSGARFVLASHWLADASPALLPRAQRLLEAGLANEAVWPDADPVSSPLGSVWPGRASGLADLALVQMLRGNDELALKTLEQALLSLPGDNPRQHLLALRNLERFHRHRLAEQTARGDDTTSTRQALQQTSSRLAEAEARGPSPDR